MGILSQRLVVSPGRRRIGQVAVPAAFIMILLSLCPSASAIGVLDSTYIIFHFHGTDTSSRAGVRIGCLGDVNGDGFDDIAVGSYSPSGTYVFYGDTVPDSIPDLFLKGKWRPIGTVDFTGDGIDDVVTSEWYWVEGHPYGAVYFYRGYGDSIDSAPFDSLFPALEQVGDYWTNFGFGAFLACGYVDGDSLGDLVSVKSDTPWGPTVLLYLGVPTLDTAADWMFKIEEASHAVVSAQILDFDGDNFDDIVLGLWAYQDTVSYVYVFGGPAPGAEPDITIAYSRAQDTLGREQKVEGVYVVGDVDGDGWEDLGVRVASTGYIYFGGPDVDSVCDLVLRDKLQYMAGCGDINGDEWLDMLAGDAGPSEYGGVFLYLGGTALDGYVDDLMLRYDLPPLFLDEIGYRAASAGDFNGDGIDDFMFSCMNFAHGHPGDVFVICGSRDIVVDVEDNEPAMLPRGIELKQNYPNPFNQGTDISFRLPTRQSVTLAIYNITGRRIRTLAHGELGAGSHTYHWDGTDADCQHVASGVYLYKLTTGSTTYSRKMVLLK